MHAQLKSISSNDFLDWEAFESSERPEWRVRDDYGWFSLDIGPEGEEGADIFQSLVATPAAVSRARHGGKGLQIVIVDEFKPESIKQLLSEKISKTAGDSWPEIVEKLRRWARWEYEGMGTS